MKKIIYICSLASIAVVSQQGIAQNVGIGNSNPAYKLDVTGRVRIRHEGQTAGIWFDGAGLATAPLSES